MNACREGENHTSLPQLLQDLNKKAEGSQHAAKATGDAVSRPLHVVVHVRPSIARRETLQVKAANMCK